MTNGCLVDIRFSVMVANVQAAFIQLTAMHVDEMQLS
jgi:hypothetical protein